MRLWRLNISRRCPRVTDARRLVSPPLTLGPRRPFGGVPGPHAGQDRVVNLLAELTDRSPAGIAATVGRLVRSGELPVGARLPTVREVATALQISPATVSGAWRALS